MVRPAGCWVMCSSCDCDVTPSPSREERPGAWAWVTSATPCFGCLFDTRCFAFCDVILIIVNCYFPSACIVSHKSRLSVSWAAWNWRLERTPRPWTLYCSRRPCLVPGGLFSCFSPRPRPRSHILIEPVGAGARPFVLKLWTHPRKRPEDEGRPRLVEASCARIG